MRRHYVGQLQAPNRRPENIELFVDRRNPDTLVESFTAGDTTPSVKTNDQYMVYKTANTSPTTISDFDDGFIGQSIHVIINDANTTIDFTASGLKGNGGSDWNPASGDSMTCYYDGTDWYCAVRGVASGVSISGTPANNQVALWTDATTIEGTSSITYDGSTLTVAALTTSFTDYVKIDAATDNFHLRNSTDLLLYNTGNTEYVRHSVSSTSNVYQMTCSPGDAFTLEVGTSFIDMEVKVPLRTTAYFQLRSETATNIADVTHAVNTDPGKVDGAMIYDSTNAKIKIATGSLDASTWVDADGTNAVTPA